MSPVTNLLYICYFFPLQGFGLVVRNEAVLGGLPASVVAAARQNALDANVTATGSNRSGPWLFKFDGATADFVVPFADNRQLRQAVFIATLNLASSGALDNSPVVSQILAWRQTKASLLGFRGNYAQFKFARMVSASLSSALYAPFASCLLDCRHITFGACPTNTASC